MGYIQRAAGIGGFSQVVMSFWFRIPQASIDAAIAQYEAIPATGSLEDVNLPGIIPLITFGEGSAITGAIPNLTSRSFIGVACGDRTHDDMVDDQPLPPPRLFAYLQYDSGLVDLFPLTITCLDYFQIGGLLQGPCALPGNAIGYDYADHADHIIPVTADAWHHLLVSFEMTGGGCAVTFEANEVVFEGTSCKFWWALDDVNYGADYLWPCNPANYDLAGGDNDIYSIGVLSNWGNGSGPHSFAAGAIPDAPCGMPAAGDDASHIHNIMRAEQKIYTGVTCDTSVEELRRLFITDAGKPAPPSLATAHFGKEPEVYFQTHEDWINGNNRGTAGNFDETGTITAYTPPP